MDGITTNVDPLTAAILTVLTALLLRAHFSNLARFRAIERKLSRIWYKLWPSEPEPPDFEADGGS